MARAPNPFYAGGYGSDPAFATFGEGLGKALFGDPEMAAKQQEARALAEARAAQAEEARAHGTLYNTQADGQRIQNGGMERTPGSIMDFFRSYAQPTPAPDVPLQPGEQPSPGDVTIDAPHHVDRTALAAAMLSAMVQAQGDKVDPKAIMAIAPGLFGGDQGGRQSLILQGQTPGKDFATTTGRADDVAAQGYDAAYKKDTAVAGINHASDIPVANIRAGATMGAARINHATDIPVAQIAANGRGNKPTQISAADSAGVDKYVNRELLALPEMKTKADPNPANPYPLPAVAPAPLAQIRRRAMANFQRGGDPAAAANEAVTWWAQRTAAQAGGGKTTPTTKPPAKTSSAPPVAGARKAADGVWYVKLPNGGYGRVDP